MIYRKDSETWEMRCGSDVLTLELNKPAKRRYLSVTDCDGDCICVWSENIPELIEMLRAALREIQDDV